MNPVRPEFQEIVKGWNVSETATELGVRVGSINKWVMTNNITLTRAELLIFQLLYKAMRVRDELEIMETEQRKSGQHS